jgi:hypothetical protein
LRIARGVPLKSNGVAGISLELSPVDRGEQPTVPMDAGATRATPFPVIGYCSIP